MARGILSVIVGFAAWTIVFMVIASGLQQGFAEAHAADGAVFDPVVLALYLLAATLASLLAGATTARVATASPYPLRAVGVLAALLLAVGLVVQLSSWGLTPAWYNLLFLGLLAPLTVLGGRLAAR